MRPKRKKIKFTEDSVNDLLQEIYNDTHIIRTRIVRILTKWEAKIKENGEIAAMGDQIIKLISEEGKSQDKKIALLKILRDIVYTNKDNTNLLMIVKMKYLIQEEMSYMIWLKMQ